MMQPAPAKSEYLVVIGLVVLTLFVYWPVTKNEFINFDDPMYVTENKIVQTGLTGENVVWALTTAETGNRHPLTWLSHMLDCHLYGLSPVGHHLTNLLLHVFNTLLLFGLLQWMTRATWAGALVAALFAWHPLHVEPVAWIAERKELLSTFFWFVSIWSYAHYAKTREKNAYFLTLSCFLLGFMAKPMIVTLPFTLLLLDYWPLNRFGETWRHNEYNGERNAQTLPRPAGITGLIVEKIPFFLLSGLFSVITYVVQQQEGAVKSISLFPWYARISNAVLSYVGYGWQMAWPHDLAVYYPHPGMQVPVWKALAAATALLALSYAAFAVRKRAPFFFTGWFWYLGTLLPVIGIIQVGAHAMADRYTYIPLAGIFMIVAWGLREICNRRRFLLFPVTAVCLLVLVSLLAATSKQIGYWKNSRSLFERTVEVTENNWMALNNLGLAWVEEGRIDKALSHYKESIRINPAYASSYNNLGSALVQKGDAHEAISNFEHALALAPGFVDARYNLANVLVQEQRLDEAVAHYRKTLKLAPEDGEIYNNFGIALMKQGRVQEAITQFHRSLKINPEDLFAGHNLNFAMNVEKHLQR